MPMFFKDSLPLASERQFNNVYTLLTPNNIFTPCKASFLWSRKARDKNVLHITEYNLPWPAVWYFNFLTSRDQPALFIQNTRHTWQRCYTWQHNTSYLTTLLYLTTSYLTMSYLTTLLYTNKCKLTRSSLETIWLILYHIL